MKEWNAHKIRKSNHSFLFGIPDKLCFFPESLGYEQSRKYVVVSEVNDVANESTVHLGFHGIHTTSELDLVNDLKYLIQASHELYQPTTWEGVKIWY